MVFCNITKKGVYYNAYVVTILILIDGFLQYIQKGAWADSVGVTILILIDGFLQYKMEVKIIGFKEGHNPYFNRWFSAIL